MCSENSNNKINSKDAAGNDKCDDEVDDMRLKH